MGSGKNFHFHLGIYIRIDAAAIVAPVAAASGGAEKYYKTRGRENLSFPLGNLLKNRITENTRDAQPQQQAQEQKYTIKHGSHTLESQKRLGNRSENTNFGGQPNA